jgi:hypothetical protein
LQARGKRDIRDLCRRRRLALSLDRVKNSNPHQDANDGRTRNHGERLQARMTSPTRSVRNLI